MDAASAETAGEKRQLTGIGGRLDSLAAFLQSTPRPRPEAGVQEWFPYLAQVKRIQGNFSNDLSFVAALMAKAYLCANLDMAPFDVSVKPQSAPGLDIDERTRDGRRVVAEIKTTTPHGATDLGAAQKTSFSKDFEKLARATADHKFFFLTDDRSFDLARTTYAARLRGTTVVLLPSGKKFVA